MSDPSDPFASPAPPPLSLAALGLRLGIIGIIMLSIVAAFAYVGGWFTPRHLTPTKFIDTFEKVSGLHPGFRRNHAKGVCVSGFFDGNGNGVSLSKASLFQTGRVPVVGRFALAGGQPYQADAAHTVRSMAILFRLKNGEEWRIGINNIPVFPVNTPQGFYDLLIASAPDPKTGKPDAGKMKIFLADHPESARAMGILKVSPVSSGFDNSTYNSLNAFEFVNDAGTKIPVRWAMVPVQPFVPIATTQPASPDQNDLFDALIAAVHQHPLQWHLIITVGQPGDATNDATIAWPADRRQVDVGTLTIDNIDSEDTSPVRDINFDPLVLPVGMLPSDDPLLSARSAAYSQSFTRREGETKSPSSVSPSETNK